MKSHLRQHPLLGIQLHNTKNNTRRYKEHTQPLYKKQGPSIMQYAPTVTVFRAGIRLKSFFPASVSVPEERHICDTHSSSSALPPAVDDFPLASFSADTSNFLSSGLPSLIRNVIALDDQESSYVQSFMHVTHTCLQLVLLVCWPFAFVSACLRHRLQDLPDRSGYILAAYDKPVRQHTRVSNN